MNEKVKAMRFIADSFDKEYDRYVFLASRLRDEIYKDLQKLSKILEEKQDEPELVEFLTETRTELADIYEIVYARADKIGEKRLGLYAKVAKMYEQSGELETASEMYFKSYDTYHEKGFELLDKLVKLKKSKSIDNQLPKEDDDSEFLLGWADKGSMLAEQGKHEEAIVCFDTAISMDKKLGCDEDSDILFRKGSSLKKLGRDKEAEQCFTKAEKLL